MEDLAYISNVRRTDYTHFLEDNDTARMSGHMVEVFVPATRLDDINKNDDNRQEVAAAIESAIEAYQSANG